LAFQHVAASTHGCCELIDILKKKKKSKTKYFKQMIEEEEEQLAETQDEISEWKNIPANISGTHGKLFGSQT